MKILHLRASNFYGGPERQIHIHARLLKDSHHDITIGSFSEEGKAPEFLNTIMAEGLKTHLFRVKSAYDMAAIRLVREFIKNNEIEILCTHDYRTHIIGFWAIKGTGSKWMAFSRGWTMDTFRVRLYHLIDKIIIRFATHIVAVSASQKNRLVRLMTPASKISIVHNAIDSSSLADIELVDLRARYRFPGDAIIALAGGRFSREKGQAYLIEAAALAIKSNSRLRFIIYGEGPDFALIKEAIVRMKLSEIILCPGFEKNLLGCLKGADMLVNPSLSEGLPNIVLEAMALSVPVVATAVGGVPELVKNERSGLLVPPSNSKALSIAILQLAEQPGLRRTLSQAAMQILKESFTFDRQAALLKEIYEQVTSGGTSGSHDND